MALNLNNLNPEEQNILTQLFQKAQAQNPQPGGDGLMRAPQAPVLQRQPGDKMDPNQAMQLIMGMLKQDPKTGEVYTEQRDRSLLGMIPGFGTVKKNVTPDTLARLIKQRQEIQDSTQRKDYWVNIGYDDEQKAYIDMNAATGERRAVPSPRLASKTMSNPSSGDLDKASALDRIDKTLSQVSAFYDPRFTGAVQNPLQNIQQRYGLEPTKDRAKFNSAVGNLKLALAEERGKNLTEMEYNMLMEAIPDVKKSDTDFEAKMEQFQDTFSFIRQQRIKRARGLMAGAEQLYIKPDTGPSPKKDSPKAEASKSKEPSFQSAEDIKKLYKAGKLSKEQAKALIRAVGK